MTTEAQNFAKFLRSESEALELPLIRFLEMIDLNYRTFKQWEDGIHAPSINRAAKIYEMLAALKEK